MIFIQWIKKAEVTFDFIQETKSEDVFSVWKSAEGFIN